MVFQHLVDFVEFDRIDCVEFDFVANVYRVIVLPP